MSLLRFPFATAQIGFPMVQQKYIPPLISDFFWYKGLYFGNHWDPGPFLNVIHT